MNTKQQTTMKKAIGNLMMCMMMMCMMRTNRYGQI